MEWLQRQSTWTGESCRGKESPKQQSEPYFPPSDAFTGLRSWISRRLSLLPARWSNFPPSIASLDRGQRILLRLERSHPRRSSSPWRFPESRLVFVGSELPHPGLRPLRPVARLPDPGRRLDPARPAARPVALRPRRRASARGDRAARRAEHSGQAISRMGRVRGGGSSRPSVSKWRMTSSTTS